MIVRDAVVEGSGNFAHLGFFNVHLSTQASSILASIKNTFAGAGIQSHDLMVSSQTPLDHRGGFVLFVFAYCNRLM